MIILIILIAIYLLSVIGAYKFFQRAYYHEKGTWNMLEPELSNLFWVLLPIGNSIWSFYFLTGEWDDTKEYGGSRLAERIFKPNKKS